MKALKESLESAKQSNLEIQIQEVHQSSDILVKERELAIREKLLEEKETRLAERERELNMLERN